MDPQQQFKYRAFISYSHADEEWAKWLHKSLETYRLPKRLVGRETEFGPVPERIAPVFRDRDELATATNLGDILTAALEQSACQLVICSRKSAKSRWVNEEIKTFKRLGKSTRSFALIVDDHRPRLGTCQECRYLQPAPGVRIDAGASRSHSGGGCESEDIHPNSGLAFDVHVSLPWPIVRECGLRRVSNNASELIIMLPLRQPAAAVLSSARFGPCHPRPASVSPGA
jgi:hypothetical protein